ncbi:MAG: sel1 repeat family protein, partial [Eggerthellaceae bacterium]|nr:sel1 repeat family protein [Eggerthellaceae bacterium]
PGKEWSQTMADTENFDLTPTDQKTLSDVVDSLMQDDELDELADDDLRELFDEPCSSESILRKMLTPIYEDGPDEFCDWVMKNRPVLIDYAESDPRVTDILILCYKMGIQQGSGNCANSLGALYYKGEFVEQDFQKACELYELAADLGDLQGIINLGYIYEYGRTGEPDFNKAFALYSYAAAVSQNYEALYKLGDMFAYGHGVEEDKDKAHILWEKSLEASEAVFELSHPALRIAKLLIDPEENLKSVDYNPLRALALFQQAEVGLRIEVANGYEYYKKQLQEVVRGQIIAREMLDIVDEDEDE